MTSIVLVRTSRRCTLKSFSRTLPCRNPCTSRLASLNSAIERGRRRSQGVGFRGKEYPAPNRRENEATDMRRSGRVVRRVSVPPSRGSPVTVTRDSWRDERPMASGGKDSGRSSNRSDGSNGQASTARPMRLGRWPIREGSSDGRAGASPLSIRRGKKDVTESGKRPRLTRAARFHDPNFRFGKNSLVQEGEGDRGIGRGRGFRKSIIQEAGNHAFRAPPSRQSPRSDRVGGRDRVGVSRRDQPEAQFQRPVDGRTRPVVNRHDKSEAQFQRPIDSRSRAGVYRQDKIETQSYKSVDNRGRASVYSNDETELPSQKTKPSSDPATKFSIHRSEGSKDNRVPLSIPYTTPASEFLYGTSVVEAALRCKRRKLYKLYIYAGEGRLDINVSRDARLEQLAKANDIPVENVHQSGLNLMDKLSKGRPHNGYLLEASPLPKLPVASLGELIVQEGYEGFAVALNHQSREEAEVNGTSNIIRLPPIRTDRKPFVLFLDSIKDPGNLGGIIRTASFLGVTAVAISTSSSTGFTPVVLKASAGAAEDMVLLSVKNPRGFITDSQRAGWKIYAAVAPSNGPRRRGSPPFVTTDVLDEGSLCRDPIILMLGDEGQGISQHLRNKADVEVSIPSRGKTGHVDSLNVSVAAGVLCQAFMRKGRRDSWSAKGQEEVELEVEDDDHVTTEEKPERVEGDLF